MSGRQPLTNLTRPHAHKGGRSLTRAEKESRTEQTGGFARIEHELVPGDKRSSSRGTGKGAV